MVLAFWRATSDSAAMIPKTGPGRQRSWRDDMAGAITDPKQLLAALDLGREWLEGARAAAALFPLRVPHPYLARMRKGCVDDPLLRQVLPLYAETCTVAGYGPDPVGDLRAQAAPGILQKYDGRTLLTTTGACAVHCRYCFRRHFPYAEANAARDGWKAVFEYLDRNPDVHELILSGGDPLTLGEDRLAQLVRGLSERPQVRRLRLHTRLPIVIPARVDDALLAWIRSIPLPLVMVVHVNHAQEIDEAVCVAMQRLRAVGVTLLNQAVLLAGVNDSVTAQVQLSETLFAAGILPYYLHVLDPVAGASHFAVPIERALALFGDVEGSLPGYLVPRLVQELAGAPAKVRLGSGMTLPNPVQ